MDQNEDNYYDRRSGPRGRMNQNVKPRTRVSPSPSSDLRAQYVPPTNHLQPPIIQEAQQEQNRIRSSSWPNKPPSFAPTQVPTTRTRSSTLSEGNQNPPFHNRRTASPQKSEPTARKKRKRLNPQRRSFYKALHTDFPKIAEALREARQGVNVVDSLACRDIIFTTIEARPPQDPTNLNVRRYNEMVFIWDPSSQVWLQVPGTEAALESPTNILQDPPANTTNFSLSAPSLHRFVSPRSSGEFSCFDSYDFVSTSEEEDDPRSLNDFLPLNIIDDIL